MSETKLPRAGDANIPTVPSGRVWNSAAGAIERAARLAVEAPLELDDGPEGPRLRLNLDPADIRPVRISGTSGSVTGTNVAYTFIQQNFDTNGAATDLPGAWTDSNTASVAFEINSTPLPAGNTNVTTLLLQTFDNQSGQPVYLFQAPAPRIIDAWLTGNSVGTNVTTTLPQAYNAIQISPSTNSTGYGTWATNSRSLVLTGNVYNTNEDNWPAAAGGTNQLANLPPGFSYGSIPTGTGSNGVRVQLTGSPNANAPGGYEWWFYKENPIVGTCS